MKFRLSFEYEQLQLISACLELVKKSMLNENESAVVKPSHKLAAKFTAERIDEVLCIIGNGS